MSKEIRLQVCSIPKNLMTSVLRGSIESRAKNESKQQEQPQQESNNQIPSSSFNGSTMDHLVLKQILLMADVLLIFRMMIYHFKLKTFLKKGLYLHEKRRFKEKLSR